MDAVGVLRKDLRSKTASGRPAVNFVDKDSIPLPLLQNIEFKYNFSIKDAVSSSYNHSLNLTDFIIAWDLAIEGQCAPFDKDMEAKSISDCFGCHGEVCVEYEDPRRPGHVHKVPKALQGYAYFITNVRNHINEEVGQQESRVGHGTIKVVALSALIRATFDPHNKGLVKVYSNSSRAEEEDDSDSLESSDTEESLPSPRGGRKRGSNSRPAAKAAPHSKRAKHGKKAAPRAHTKQAKTSKKAAPHAHTKQAKISKPVRVRGRGRGRGCVSDSSDSDSDYTG